MNNDISIVETLAVVVLGMVVVFAVLMLLWVCIAIESKVVAAMQEKQAAAEPAPAAPAPAAPAPAATPAPLARGSCGPVMLHDVPDRTAAMVMAIVADELKTPLNELRFISIKEVK